MKELFDRIRGPRRENVFGSYASFLASPILNHVIGRDLAHALEWIARQPSRHHLNPDLVHLLNGILEKSWHSLAEEPSLSRPFARAAVSRLRAHEEIFEDDAASSAHVERVRQLVLLLVREVEEDAPLPSLVFGPRLLWAGDCAWVLAQIESETEAVARRRLLVILEEVLRVPPVIESATLVDKVLMLVRRDLLARLILRHLVEPVDLDSEVAAQARASHQQRVQREKLLAERRERAPDNFSRKEALAFRLERIRRNEPTAWGWLAVTIIVTSARTGP